MIVEVTKPKSSFLDFMLYQEKDDAPRRNMKVINLKVSDKRRQDFTKGAEIEDEEEQDNDNEKCNCCEEDYECNDDCYCESENGSNEKSKQPNIATPKTYKSNDQDMRNMLKE